MSSVIGAILPAIPGLISGSSGGGSKQPSLGATRDADLAWQQAMWRNLQGLQDLSAVSQPQMNAAYASMLGIPTGGLTSAGQQAGGYLGNLAGQADQMHNLMAAMYGPAQYGQGLEMGAGQQLWNTALDPQNALRNKLQGDVTQASRAGTTARGIGMSPQAAGIENQDVQNFLMNWENQQLGRQAQGLQGMTGAMGQAGQQGLDAAKMLTGALEMGSLAPQYLQQAATTPFQMNQMAAEWPMQATNMFNQAYQQNFLNPWAQLQQSMLPYLGLGAATSAAQFGQNQQNLGNVTGALGQIGNQLPNIFSGLGNLFGGGTTGTTQQPYTGGGSSWDNPYGYTFGG